jgi:DNA-binding NarL/FixJ family response regulator
MSRQTQALFRVQIQLGAAHGLPRGGGEDVAAVVHKAIEAATKEENVGKRKLRKRKFVKAEFPGEFLEELVEDLHSIEKGNAHREAQLSANPPAPDVRSKRIAAAAEAVTKAVAACQQGMRLLTPRILIDSKPSQQLGGSRVAKVFIVDDHPATRDGLAARLSSEPDLEVCGTAAELGEAIREVEAAAPDLVIMDLGLRRGDGLELIRRLKDRGNPPKMLVWSWRSETIYAERALRAGALGFISKSESTSAILDAIRKVLAGDVYLHPDSMSVIVRRNVAGLDKVASSDSLAELSNRELEVFQLTGQGLDTVQVAEKLRVSPKTVETYKARIKEKLGLNSGSEMLFRAMRWVLENDAG